MLLSTQYEPVRLPTKAAPAVIYSHKALVPLRETTPSGLPGSSTDLSPLRCPLPPRKASPLLLPLASRRVSGFILGGGLATFKYP